MLILENLMQALEKNPTHSLCLWARTKANIKFESSIRLLVYQTAWSMINISIFWLIMPSQLIYYLFLLYKDDGWFIGGPLCPSADEKSLTQFSGSIGFRSDPFPFSGSALSLELTLKILSPKMMLPRPDFKRKVKRRRSKKRKVILWWNNEWGTNFREEILGMRKRWTVQTWSIELFQSC